MKKAMIGKVIVTLIAVLGLSAVLAGCGGGGAASSAATGDASASASAATSAATDSSASASAAASAATDSGSTGSTGATTDAKGTGTPLQFVTGGESGTYYAFGSVIAQHATNNAGVNLNAVAGNGSQANVQELQDGISDLAFCQSDVMAYAYEGINLFEDSGKVDCFSTVACLYDEQVQIVTCDPSIKTVDDLKGKNVSVGAAGSGVYFNAIDVLAAYGMTLEDINPTYESFADTTNSIKDGKIDAGFVVAGAPTTSITDLSVSKQAYLVSLDDEHVEKLLQSSDYYSETVIPAGTYDGIDEDITTVSVGAVILANDTVAEDDIYALCADLFTDPASLVESHAKYAEISAEKGASITSVPYHPGAAKYFQEQGFTVTSK
ncbi:MAG: TAXI family TRAP transporter solute-binding subunit [Eggerthellaceae bacterium]|nr:TAXI family TRAP transporter solute-binding subunit [Eggerthellaceae bacterium]